jgi:hypothetical protein
MKQTNLFLIVALLTIYVTSQQTATLTAQGNEYNDLQFLKTINNYFGCKTWQDGICV